MPEWSEHTQDITSHSQNVNLFLQGSILLLYDSFYRISIAAQVSFHVVSRYRIYAGKRVAKLKSDDIPISRIYLMCTLKIIWNIIIDKFKRISILSSFKRSFHIHSELWWALLKLKITFSTSIGVFNNISFTFYSCRLYEWETSFFLKKIIDYLRTNFHEINAWDWTVKMKGKLKTKEWKILWNVESIASDMKLFMLHLDT